MHAGYFDSHYASLDDESVKELQTEIHTKVFMTYLRMSTYKESSEAHITPSAFGDIIYENYLFDIPKLMDICVLYGKGNEQLLRKMLQNIFGQQPKYMDDLEEAIPTIMEVLDNIQKRLIEEKALTPQRLDTEFMTPLSPHDIADLVVYVTDISVTLHWFLEMYPPASTSFLHGLVPIKVAVFCDNVIPGLKKDIKRCSGMASFSADELKRLLSFARLSFVKFFRKLVFFSCLKPCLENRPEAGASWAESFLQVIASCVTERKFISDYDRIFSFVEDIELLKQNGCSLDMTRIAFISNAIVEVNSLLGRQENRGAAASSLSTQSLNMEAEVPATAACVNGADNMPTSQEGEDYDSLDEGACAGPKLSGVELESLISSVKDLLPDLGDGFIIECLEYYNYDVEQVINHLLCDSLPEALQGLDRVLPRKAKKKATVLSSRFNVFDGDEFDVFTRDKIDMSRVHMGKREAKDTTVVLDDKSHVEKLKDYIRERFTVVSDDDDDEQADVYDDEYDDTYDANQVGADDADSADELLSRRPFVTPRVFTRNDEVNEDVQTPQQKQELEEKVTWRPGEFVPFVTDPALLREKAEQRRQAMRARGRGGPPPSRVEGKPKGQGQDGSTTHARQRKEQHKGSKANHNRKAMASRKMAKGMF
ncbi:PREDICTED: activating signal cointegrator 1 complex subunit 2-like [Priapulus caudatus]|uniref:Activating signal cointegrator 1 complex subunit 2-like n=1 Tax=Priapulus caudatus TaxID=37621 RepID=A0ABM1EWV6_PRICU|nr:PREDICTED: activating signal cointegrator 1 complex subunit 2-like [Priapulus caudatus]